MQKNLLRGKVYVIVHIVYIILSSILFPGCKFVLLKSSRWTRQGGHKETLNCGSSCEETALIWEC
jgi:hypothetical protein